MRQARREMHYGTLDSDEALCGVNIARGGWTKIARRVTCHTCLARLANQRIDAAVRMPAGLQDRTRSDNG